MPEKPVPAPAESARRIQQAVGVDTRKIFDSCLDKDCVDELRVYPTVSSQTALENALSVRPRGADLLYVDVSVSSISFNRGYYTVDCTYFYRVSGESFPAGQTVTGLAVFDKRVMLFGSVASVKSFSSDDLSPSVANSELPRAVVDAVNPIALQMSLKDAAEPVPGEPELRDIPEFILDAFDEPLVLTDTPRRWYTTLGQFSIVRMERDTQLTIPAYEYLMPDKECPGSSEDDPCALFGRIPFPSEEFFPPDSVEDRAEYKNLV
ncbi:MAG: hypothetical protein K6G17_02490 [Oscillospiraceae bacterium]|nr:hypothetical protein [Oscillospiraceae bacterium]